MGRWACFKAESDRPLDQWVDPKPLISWIQFVFLVNPNIRFERWIKGLKIRITRPGRKFTSKGKKKKICISRFLSRARETEFDKITPTRIKSLGKLRSTRTQL